MVPGHTQSSEKSFPSLGLIFPPLKWGEASILVQGYGKAGRGGRRVPGRPLPPGPNLAQDPTWLLFLQNNVQQAGGLGLLTGLLAQESSFLLSSLAAAGPLAWGCTGHR